MSSLDTMGGDISAVESTPLLHSSLQGKPTYQPNALPSQDPINTIQANDQRDETPKRRIGPFDGIALVLGLQIGSGIFASPSLVVQNTMSEPMALVIWCFAGVLAWACAACYIELGIRMPLNGGPQEYLVYCFNDLFGFLASWGCIFAVKPCSTAILALFISNYLCDALELENGPFDLVRKSGALITIALIATINCIGNSQSKITTKILLACKIIGVGFIIVMGFGSLIVSRDSTPIFKDQPSTLPRPGLSNYTDATLQAMWAYSGWETLALVGGELENPNRNIALVINTSMAIVTVFSILANIAYFLVLPLEEIVRSTSIGLIFSQHFLGYASSAAYTVLICLSTLGALNVKAFTAGRLTQSAAQRRYLPPLMKTVKRMSSEYRDEDPDKESQFYIRELLLQPMQYGDGSIPISGIIFNSLLGAVYVVFGQFRFLVIFIGIVEYSVVFLTLLGLVAIRLDQRSAQNDGDHILFRVPWILIFLALCTIFVVVCVSVIQHPLAGIGCVIFCALSIGIYKCNIQIGRQNSEQE